MLYNEKHFNILQTRAAKLNFTVNAHAGKDQYLIQKAGDTGTFSTTLNEGSFKQCISYMNEVTELRKNEDFLKNVIAKCAATKELHEFFNHIIPFLTAQLATGYRLKNDGNMYQSDADALKELISAGKTNFLVQAVQGQINNGVYRIEATARYQLANGDWRTHSDWHNIWATRDNKPVTHEVEDYLRAEDIIRAKRDAPLYEAQLKQIQAKANAANALLRGL